MKSEIAGGVRMIRYNSADQLGEFAKAINATEVQFAIVSGNKTLYTA